MKTETTAKEQFIQDVKAIDPHQMATLAANLPDEGKGEDFRLAKAFRLIHGAITFLREAQTLETDQSIKLLVKGSSTISAAKILDVQKLVYSFAEAAEILGYANEAGIERLILREYTGSKKFNFVTGEVIPVNAKEMVSRWRKDGINGPGLEVLRLAKHKHHSEQGRKNRIKGLKRKAGRKLSK